MNVCTASQCTAAPLSLSLGFTKIYMKFCIAVQVYCIAYELLDKEWLHMRASYMDFSAVMKRVRAQLAAGLATRPSSVSQLRNLLLKPA
jgi:hypothetical protein